MLQVEDAPKTGASLGALIRFWHKPQLQPQVGSQRRKSSPSLQFVDNVPWSICVAWIRPGFMNVILTLATHGLFGLRIC